MFSCCPSSHSIEEQEEEEEDEDEDEGEEEAADAAECFVAALDDMGVLNKPGDAADTTVTHCSFDLQAHLARNYIGYLVTILAQFLEEDDEGCMLNASDSLNVS